MARIRTATRAVCRRTAARCTKARVRHILIPGWSPQPPVRYAPGGRARVLSAPLWRSQCPVWRARTDALAPPGAARLVLGAAGSYSYHLRQGARSPVHRPGRPGFR